MATFVLIAGAGHGAWSWKYVTPLLTKAGHKVLTPDLAGLGADKTPLDQVGLQSWAETLAALIRAEPEPVILAGHSRGGAVISQTAEYAPERIRGLVYISAVLIPSGKSAADVVKDLGLEAKGGFTLRRTPDGLAVVFDMEEMRRCLYNQTAPERFAEAAALVRPEPLSGLGGVVQLTEARFGRVPRFYIECVNDRALSLEAQRALQRAMPCRKSYPIDADHSPFFSAPAELVAALTDIAAAANT
jgi:pimeloyl-ACP methyl ester carboxylesterase